MTQGKKISDADIERLRKLREAGLSVRQVARAENVSPQTVQKFCKNTIAK